MTLTYLFNRRNVVDSPWTEQRVEALKYLWAEGYSASECAAELADRRITRSAVMGKVHRLKLPARKPRVRAIRPDTRRPRAFLPKPAPPPPQPKLPPPPPAMRGLTLFQLTSRSCRWPIGDSPFLFCGSEASGVYCAFHERLARAA